MTTSEQRHAIEELVYRSCLALDAKDWKAFLELCDPGFRYAITAFSPEIRKDMTWLDHERDGFATLLGNLSKHNSDHSPITRHATVYTVDVDAGGKEAKVISALQVFRTALDGGSTELFAVGHFHVQRVAAPPSAVSQPRTSCTVSETVPTAPTGYTFGTPTFSPSDTVMIGAGTTVEVTTNNTLTRDLGNLKLSKSLTGGPCGYTGPFTIHYDCGVGFTGDVSVAADSFQTVSGIPSGTSCTVSEPPLPTQPAATPSAPRRLAHQTQS